MHTEETTIAKLRNYLTPIYSLAEMILLMDKNPGMKEIIVESAKQVFKSKENLQPLLAELETEDREAKFMVEVFAVLYDQSERLKQFCIAGKAIDWNPDENDGCRSFDIAMENARELIYPSDKLECDKNCELAYLRQNDVRVPCCMIWRVRTNAEAKKTCEQQDTTLHNSFIQAGYNHEHHEHNYVQTDGLWKRCAICGEVKPLGE